MRHAGGKGAHHGEPVSPTDPVLKEFDLGQVVEDQKDLPAVSLSGHGCRDEAEGYCPLVGDVNLNLPLEMPEPFLQSLDGEATELLSKPCDVLVEKVAARTIEDFGCAAVCGLDTAVAVNGDHAGPKVL